MLSAGSLVSLFGQMPGGAIVDMARSERLVAGLAVTAIGISALGYAAWPILPVVLSAAVLHSAASCVLGPAIAAISLGLVGHRIIGERLGRNARFASIGNGLAAAAMGAVGYVSPRAVFVVTAMLLVPALIALRAMAASEIDAERAHGGVPKRRDNKPPRDFADLLRQRPLLILAGCVMLFHLANAAMLPLMGSVVTMQSSQWATVLIAACIVVPQLVVAALSPWVGRRAQTWGRRPLLIIGFAALPIRGLLFATVKNPEALVVVQISGRTDRVRIRRPGAADHRRSHARHRAFQSRPGHCRHDNRIRGIPEHDARGLCQRSLRQRVGLPQPGGRGLRRPRGGLAADAGDAPGTRVARALPD